MRFIYTLAFLITLHACGRIGGKSENELKYDSIQDVFQENQLALDEFVELALEADKAYTWEYYHDLTRLPFDSMCLKYRINDDAEALFLSSIAMTAQSIKLKNSLKQLSTETDTLLRVIYKDSNQQMIDSILPLQLEDNLKYKLEP